MTSAIIVDSLVKRYGSHTAVDNISFEVPTGSTFAFLGTNGAGKSTTISCLTASKRPTSGMIRVGEYTVGRNDREIHRKIGVVFQESLLDPILTVQENLMIRASLYGLRKDEARKSIRRLSALLDTDEFMDRRYGKLSGGQKRRADIVRALLHDPKILFLDEPTTGLDPDSRERVWETILDLQRTLNLTVFLTTHYMEETEQADEVCIIDHGRIVAAGSPSALRAEHSRDELRVTVRKTGTFDREIGYSFESRGDDRYIQVDSWREALDILTANSDDITDFEFRHGTMDDVFLNITRAGVAS